MHSLEDDLALISIAARKAGEIAIEYFGARNEARNKVWQKHGNSPVSEADYAVDAYLKKTLLEARPDYGWLSEETEDNTDRLGFQRIFVVDPIDGTRGFLAGRSQWCVSVAIVEDTLPVAGALECPVLDEHFTASLAGGAFLNGSRMPPLEGSTIGSITGSRKLIEIIEALDDNSLSVIPFIPSLAYRLAMVANRKLDAALARPGAHDWDLAAADIVLREVGGKLTDMNGNQRVYNQPDPRSGSLLASGKAAHGSLMELAKSGGFLH